MPEINQGKIFLKAAIHALVAGAKELPGIGIAIKNGTLAHIALPVSAKASLQDRAEFYRSLLPTSRPQ